MEQQLKLRPEQRELSAAQQAEAERFVAGWIEAQLATTPVDEGDAVAHLVQAYVAAGLDGPRHIHWVDSPLELAAILGHDYHQIAVAERFTRHIEPGVWEHVRGERAEIGLTGTSVARGVDFQVTAVWQRAEAALKETYGPRSIGGLLLDIWFRVGARLWRPLTTKIGDRVWEAVGEQVHWPVVPEMREQRAWTDLETILWHGTRAYEEASRLAYMRFCDVYLAPNAVHAMARFNQVVSGYWLGRELALLVRRPQLLARDDQGRLHHATGPCIEYPNGWGFSAWHGVRVPERVILAPERLTREDYLNEPDWQVRRVMQERMDDRFIWEMQGRFIDGGPQGVLYEVDLLDDRERVARYVQVQEASTGRDVFLRVPPTIATVAEALAWTSGPPAKWYRPAE